MNRYKLTIEYDGKNFNGWQKQKNMKTVQGIIEESLFKFSGKWGRSNPYIILRGGEDNLSLRSLLEF